MPVLHNVRWELFAQGRAKGVTLGPAYTAAGFKPVGPSASTLGEKLSRKPAIKKRIAEIQKQGAKKSAYTIAKATTELEKAREVAVDTKNPAAMVAAIMGKAKVNGLLVDKHLLAHKSIDDMTEDELRALLGIADA